MTEESFQRWKRNGNFTLTHERILQVSNHIGGRESDSYTKREAAEVALFHAWEACDLINEVARLKKALDLNALNSPEPKQRHFEIGSFVDFKTRSGEILTGRVLCLDYSICVGPLKGLSKDTLHTVDPKDIVGIHDDGLMIGEKVKFRWESRPGKFENLSGKLVWKGDKCVTIRIQNWSYMIQKTDLIYYRQKRQKPKGRSLSRRD